MVACASRSSKPENVLRSLRFSVHGTVTYWIVGLQPSRSTTAMRPSMPLPMALWTGCVERLDKALPLKLLLLWIHGVRDVHGQHEGKIDLALRRGWAEMKEKAEDRQGRGPRPG